MGAGIAAGASHPTDLGKYGLTPPNPDFGPKWLSLNENAHQGASGMISGATFKSRKWDIRPRQPAIQLTFLHKDSH